MEAQLIKNVPIRRYQAHRGTQASWVMVELKWKFEDLKTFPFSNLQIIRSSN